jgi:uncharacterized protein (DUF1800 family)
MAITADAAQKALIAFHRFGLGPKASYSIASIAANPQAALRAEVNLANVARIPSAGLPTYAVACREGTYDMTRAEVVRRREIDARIDKHLSAKIGFVERLVLFWSNHFSMSVKKSPIVRSSIGQLERDVIRKHVLGKFSNMLIGVTKHPAMLSYLDNASSVGPGSPAGISSSLGFNENLAREILELHTMSRAGNHTEADVRAFTRILTGWSYVRGPEADNGSNGGTQANRGQFIFRANWHEPDPIAFMGKIYPDLGLQQGEMVLTELAKHAATAQHIAFKLVQHFIADEPTAAMVNPIRNAFLNSGGNLKTVALALINLPAAWSTPLNKIRTPYELKIAQFRALGYRYADTEYPLFMQMLSTMQHTVWECPQPTGYSDLTLDWLNPDGMTLRLDTALRVSRTYGSRYTGSVPSLANRLYNRALTPETRERVAAAGDRRDQQTVLFASPEFQRR